MHSLAQKNGVPFNKIPNEFSVSESLSKSFKDLLKYYDKKGSLLSVHRKMRNLERSIDILSNSIKSIKIPSGRVRGVAGASSLRNKAKATKKKLIESKSFAANEIEDLKIQIFDILEDQGDNFFKLYNEFRNSFIHTSHFPFNRTAGMGAQELQINHRDNSYQLYQREIFYIES